jgi:hypothetical protein
VFIRSNSIEPAMAVSVSHAGSVYDQRALEWGGHVRVAGSKGERPDRPSTWGVKTLGGTTANTIIGSLLRAVTSLGVLRLDDLELGCCSGPTFFQCSYRLGLDRGE